MKRKIIFSLAGMVFFMLMLTNISIAESTIDEKYENTVVNTTVKIHGSFLKDGRTNNDFKYGCGWDINYYGKKDLQYTLSIEIKTKDKVLYEEESETIFCPEGKSGKELGHALEPVEKTSFGYIMIQLDDGNYTKITVVPIIIFNSGSHYNRLIVLLRRPVTRSFESLN